MAANEFLQITLAVIKFFMWKWYYKAI